MIGAVHIKNALQTGPKGVAGSQGIQGIQGIQGVQGNTGPAGMVILAENSGSSSTLANVTAQQSFSLNTVLPAGFWVAGRIIEYESAGTWTVTGGQQIAFTSKIGAIGAQNTPNFILAGNDNGFFVCTLELKCRTTGVGGLFDYKFTCSIQNASGSVLQSTCTAGVAANDTTIAQTISSFFAATVANNTALQTSFIAKQYN